MNTTFDITTMTMASVSNIRKVLYDNICQLYQYFVDNKLYMYKEYNESYNDIYHLYRSENAIDLLKMANELLDAGNSKIHNSYIGSWTPVIMFEDSKGILTIFGNFGYSWNIRKMAGYGEVTFDIETLVELQELLIKCKNKIQENK